MKTQEELKEMAEQLSEMNAEREVGFVEDIKEQLVKIIKNKTTVYELRLSLGNVLSASEGYERRINHTEAIVETLENVLKF